LKKIPKVYNIKNKQIIIPEGAIYIGRPSKWGNPFSHMPYTLAKFKCIDRSEAISSYLKWLQESRDGRQLIQCIHELKGKDLACFCMPLACHGDILLKLANEDLKNDNDETEYYHE